VAGLPRRLFLSTFIALTIINVYIRRGQRAREDQLQKRDDKPKLRDDLTEEQKAAALKIGRIEFKSSGATRKR
jgi:hypothetical protein